MTPRLYSVFCVVTCLNNKLPHCLYLRVKERSYSKLVLTKNIVLVNLITLNTYYIHSACYLGKNTIMLSIYILNLTNMNLICSLANSDIIIIMLLFFLHLKTSNIPTYIRYTTKRSQTILTFYSTKSLM